MANARDITAVEQVAWNEAVARAAVLRRLSGQERLSRADVLGACQELGIRRARLYQLLRVYRAHPVTSSAGQPTDRVATGIASPVRCSRGADRCGDPDLLPDTSKAKRQCLAQGGAAALLAKRDPGAKLACDPGEGEDDRSEKPHRGPRRGERGAGTASGRFPVNIGPTMPSRSCKSITRWSI